MRQQAKKPTEQKARKLPPPAVERNPIPFRDVVQKLLETPPEKPAARAKKS